MILNPALETTGLRFYGHRRLSLAERGNAFWDRWTPLYFGSDEVTAAKDHPDVRCTGQGTQQVPPF